MKPISNIFIEVKNDLIINQETFIAYEGFSLYNEICFFTFEEILSEKYKHLYKTNCFVGSLRTMKTIFRQIEKSPQPIDYPQTVLDSGLIRRKIVKTNLKSFLKNPKEFKYSKEFFVKSVETKLFSGIYTKEQLNDFYKVSKQQNLEIYVSEKIDILAEYRVYIHDRKIVYSSCYDGDFRLPIDFDDVENYIRIYGDEQPISYTIDVAVLNDSTFSTTVVEFNDFYSIGCYGLNCEKYSEMLYQRYFQIVC